MKKTAGKQSSERRNQVLPTVKEAKELLNFLLENYKGKNRNNIKSLLAYKQVEVNGTVQTKHNFILKPGDNVTIRSDRETGTQSFDGFSIIFEDPHLIVIDKHSGILSVSTDKEREKTAYFFLSRHVKTENPANKIFIVHRLDKETSGLMVFAKSKKVQALFQDHWKETITERSYLAIVEGNIADDEGAISSYLHENKALVVYSDQNPEGGKKAVTHYRVLKRDNDFTLLQVSLETGRKNQIRVHMKELGHPVVNDKKYGSTANPIGRLGLHSKTLGFIHPVTGKPFRFETPLPRKFSRLF